MERETTNFEDRTEAAIEALVDMYLSRPVQEQSPEATASESKPASEPEAQPVEIETAPIETPIRAMAPSHTETVLIGHLPGLANPWLSQYAASRVRPDRPVAICHLFAEQVEIELVHGEPAAPLVSPGADPALDTALDGLADRVGLWLVRVGAADTTIARSACAAIGTWTLLSGADEAAVVAAYRLIKQARLPLDEIDPAQRRVQLMLAGCREEQADLAADKIAQAVQNFLHLPAEWIGTRPRMQPINKQRFGIYRNPPRTHAEPAWAALLRFLTERLPEPTEAPEPPMPRAADSPPPLRLHTDEPDELGEDEPITTTHEEPAAEEPTQPTAQRPSSLTAYVEDLQLLAVRCPLNENVELAIDSGGALHAMHRADGIHVHQGMAALFGVRAWIDQHAALLHRACEGRPMNTASVTLHLFTDTPRPVIAFCLAGGPAHPAIKLHLLQTVRLGDDDKPVHTELN